MPQHSPAAITPSILPLYVGLRSQLSLDASSLASSDDFITAVDLVGAARHSFKTSFDLQSFLRNVGGFDKNLNDRILGLSPDTIIRDERVIGAWAELLSLRKLPHPQLGYSEEAVWSAVDHLVSIATIATIATHPARNDTETSPADAQPDTLSGSKAIGSPFTPHKRPPEPPDDTPVHANSGLHFSTSLQECARVDSYLRTELRDTVLKDVGGFSTFFNGITETEWACAISCPPKCACQWPAHNDCVREIELAPILRVPGFPSTRNPSQHSVLEWFANFNQVVSSPRGFYHSPTRPLSHSHSSSKRQCDLFLATRSASAALANNTHAWPNVLVPIELKASPLEDCTSDTIVQLASYVREVFGAQINRRFVHAFAICGPFFRCYLFDRAGVSISQRLCISKNDKTQALFARILVGYMRMSAQELGFDTHYLYPENNQPDGPVSFMPTPLAPKPQYLLFDGRKFRLEKPLFHRAVIVSRGTLCWLGEDVDTGEQCVIKDSWRASWRTSEGKLLALAGDRGVLGIAHPVVYGDVKLDSDNDQVDSIVSLRSGLSYSSATRVIIPTKPLDGVYFLSSTKCVPVNTETTTSAKRRSGEQLGSEHRKTAKLNSSNQTPTTGASRSVTKSQTRSQASHTSLIGEAVTPGTTTQYSTRVDPSCPPGGYMQLTHSVIVTSPIGERIEKFRSIRELLEAFRDAIRCTYYLLINSAATIFNAYLKTRPPIPRRIRRDSP